MWENKKTVSFQQYKNNNFRQKDLTSFACTYYENARKDGTTRCFDLKHQKNKAFGSLYPNSSSHEQCSMMLLSNLAEPEWIQIGCTEKVLVDVVCIIKTNYSKTTNINNHVNENGLICPINAISKDTRCYLFSWHSIKKSTDLKLYWRLNFAVPVQGLDIQYFLYLFDVIQNVLPPILYQTDRGKLYRFTYEKYLSVYHFNQTILSNTNVEGLTLCTLQKISIVNRDNVFQM